MCGHRDGPRVNYARTEVLVVGSGAGGAVTAHELAHAGAKVLVIEEGGRFSLEDYGQPSPLAMPKLYRRGGMTPILGSAPIGYVEGSCLGGSTEINSGFWHRAPRETLTRWKVQMDLEGSSDAESAPHYAWARKCLASPPTTDRGPKAPSSSPEASIAWGGLIKKCREQHRGAATPMPARRAARRAPSKA